MDKEWNTVWVMENWAVNYVAAGSSALRVQSRQVKMIETIIITIIVLFFAAMFNGD